MATAIFQLLRPKILAILDSCLSYFISDPLANFISSILKIYSGFDHFSPLVLLHLGQILIISCLNYCSWPPHYLCFCLFLPYSLFSTHLYIQYTEHVCLNVLLANSFQTICPQTWCHLEGPETKISSFLSVPSVSLPFRTHLFSCFEHC